MKKRPRGIPDVRKATMDTKMTIDDFKRESTRKQLHEEHAFRETIFREAQCRENYVFQRLDEEYHEKDVVYSNQWKKEMANQIQQQTMARNKQLLEKEALDRKKEAEDKKKLQILQNSTDFREFQRQLKATEVTNEQLAQITSKVIEKLNEKEKQTEERRKMEEYLKKQKENEQRKEHLSQMQKREYKGLLLEQIKNLDERKKREETDRKMAELNTITKTENEETKIDLKKKFEMRCDARRIYEEYVSQYNEQRAKERELAEMEAQNVHKYVTQQEERLRLQQEVKNALYREQEELKEKVARMILEERQRGFTEDHQRMARQELEKEERQNCEQETEYRMEQEKRQTMHTSFLQQVKRREDQLYHELAEEEKYREKIQSELAKTRVEIQQSTCKKGAQMEYLKELRQMMEETQERKNIDKEMESSLLQMNKQLHLAEETIVKMEKQRLIMNKSD